MHALELRLTVRPWSPLLTRDEDVQPAVIAEGSSRYLEIPQPIQAVHVQPLHGPFLIQEPVQQRAARSLRRLDSPRNRVGVGFHRMSVWVLICLVAIAEEEVKPPLMHDRDAQIGADETDRLGVESW